MRRWLRQREKIFQGEVKEEKMVQYSPKGPKGGQKEALWNGMNTVISPLVYPPVKDSLVL